MSDAQNLMPRDPELAREVDRAAAAIVRIQIGVEKLRRRQRRKRALQALAVAGLIAVAAVAASRWWRTSTPPETKSAAPAAAGDLAGLEAELLRVVHAHDRAAARRLAPIILRTDPLRLPRSTASLACQALAVAPPSEGAKAWVVAVASSHSADTARVSAAASYRVMDPDWAADPVVSEIIRSAENAE